MKCDPYEECIALHQKLSLGAGDFLMVYDDYAHAKQK